MKSPAMAAKTHIVRDCTVFPIDTPMHTPIKHNTDDTRLHMIACFIDIPAVKRDAKSPIRIVK